ncbi:MAG: TetR/AcrR family transcriptional regulator [Treponema sp.]|jgi:AcrR family transcriptional regulator|nr:TetR/AcrR family transcriptional regulator [Treponema sp.]
MRTIKEAEIRKGEILDAAEKLFAVKGYETATVNDILSAVNIAKGTFYYHFKSKEDVLDGIVKRQIDMGLEKAQVLAADSRLSVEEKLLSVFMAQKLQKPAEEKILPVIHEPANALLHQKILSEYVLRLSPILTDIIQEGIAKKVFKNTPYPREITEILLTAGLVIFDTAYFHWTIEEQTQRVAAFICAIERLIGAKPGSLARLSGIFTA